MDIHDMEYLCTVMGNLAGIPIRLYQGRQLIFYHSTVFLPKDPLDADQEAVWGVSDHVGYFVTVQFSYYGIVNAGDKKLILGPTRQVSSSERELQELAFRADVPAEDLDAFLSGMRSIVRMPMDSVIQMLCAINFIWSGERLGLEDVTITETEQRSLKQLLEQQKNDKPINAFFAETQAHPNVYNSLELEQKMLRMVRKGDTAALREWIAAAPAIRGGTLAADQLRQVKNTFIVSTTLVSRAAIQGGLDVEDAFALSDAFIQKGELLNSVHLLTNLQYHMVLEFTERVERIRHGAEPSQMFLSVANYVQHHISEPIRTEDLAKALYMSRPYLSARFRQESGQTLTDFILKEKVEEAKRLLRYTDKSLPAIGLYLGFSSPSHFSRVFKKYAGCTPGGYREKYT